MKFQLFILLIAGTILVGCGGQSGGIAPSITVVDPAVPPAPQAQVENNFKYGETTTSINGWEAVIDTTDSVENVTLANGWNVEVKYE